MNFELLKAEINECLIRAKSKETIDTLSYLMEFAENHLNNGWIDIKERLPNKDGKYLVHYQTQVLCDGRYLPKFDVVNYASCIRHFDFYHNHITHWQPLPKSPIKELSNE